MGNKVHFGLCNVHVAPIKDDGSYDTPVAIEGAVNINLSKEGNETKFYADNTLFYTANQNNGYSGDIEVTNFPQDLLSQLLGWGDEADSTTGMWLEDADGEAQPFALLFQVDGANDNSKLQEAYVLYKCILSRPDLAAETVGEDREPKTQTATITATAKEFTIGSAKKNIIKGCLENTTANASKWATFFTTVAVPTASA